MSVCLGPTATVTGLDTNFVSGGFIRAWYHTQTQTEKLKKKGKKKGGRERGKQRKKEKKYYVYI